MTNEAQKNEPDLRSRMENYVRQMLMSTGSVTLGQVDEYAPKFTDTLIALVEACSWPTEADARLAELEAMENRLLELATHWWTDPSVIAGKYRAEQLRAVIDGDDLAQGPMPKSVLPCGCHVRRPDYKAILCAPHAAEVAAAMPPGESQS